MLGVYKGWNPHCTNVRKSVKRKKKPHRHTFYFFLCAGSKYAGYAGQPTVLESQFFYILTSKPKNGFQLFLDARVLKCTPLWIGPRQTTAHATGLQVHWWIGRKACSMLLRLGMLVWEHWQAWQSCIPHGFSLAYDRTWRPVASAVVHRGTRQSIGSRGSFLFSSVSSDIPPY